MPTSERGHGENIGRAHEIVSILQSFARDSLSMRLPVTLQLSRNMRSLLLSTELQNRCSSAELTWLHGNCCHAGLAVCHRLLADDLKSTHKPCGRRRLREQRNDNVRKRGAPPCDSVPPERFRCRTLDAAAVSSRPVRMCLLAAPAYSPRPVL